MAGHISGKAGQVLAPTGITGIKSWSIDYVADTLEVTDFADVGIKAYVIGGSGWSGSFEGFKDTTPLAVATSDTPISAEFKESGTSGQTWTGSIFITGVHSTAGIDGIVSYSYDFQGTAGLTKPTA